MLSVIFRALGVQIIYSQCDQEHELMREKQSVLISDHLEQASTAECDLPTSLWGENSGKHGV